MKYLKYAGNSIIILDDNIDVLRSAPRLTQKEIKYLKDIKRYNIRYNNTPDKFNDATDLIDFDYIKQQLTVNGIKALLVKNPELLELFI